MTEELKVSDRIAKRLERKGVSLLFYAACKKAPGRVSVDEVIALHELNIGSSMFRRFRMGDSKISSTRIKRLRDAHVTSGRFEQAKEIDPKLTDDEVLRIFRSVDFQVFARAKAFDNTLTVSDVARIEEDIRVSEYVRAKKADPKLTEAEIARIQIDIGMNEFIEFRMHNPDMSLNAMKDFAAKNVTAAIYGEVRRVRPDDADFWAVGVAATIARGEMSLKEYVLLAEANSAMQLHSMTLFLSKYGSAEDYVRYFSLRKGGSSYEGIEVLATADVCPDFARELWAMSPQMEYERVAFFWKYRDSPVVAEILRATA